MATSYAVIRKSLLDGDVALMRPSGVLGNLIRGYGRSEYSHAMLCCWRRADQQTLLAAESREGVGSRLVTLSHLVQRWPGRIDIFRVAVRGANTAEREDIERITQRAATLAVNWSGHAYNYPGVLKAWLARKPLLRIPAERLGIRFDFTARGISAWDAPKFCSQMVAWAYRQAALEISAETGRDVRYWQVDPAPGIHDAWVEPGDLARGLRRVYEGLTP